MKDVNQMIADLSLDWREAADLQQVMADMERQNPTLIGNQRPAFKALWGAIRIACNRSVNEKRPTRRTAHAQALDDAIHKK